MSKQTHISTLLKLFRQFGYEGLTLSKISRETGLGKASLYHHFPGGKAQMAEAALAQVNQWLETSILQLLPYSEQRWEALSRINELVQQAIETTFKQDYDRVKRFLLPIIQQEIWTSADIAKGDRTPMILKIREELKGIGLESNTPRQRSLYSIMQRPLPEIDEETEADLKALEQVFG